MPYLTSTKRLHLGALQLTPEEMEPLSEEAFQDRLKRQWRRLVRIHHPDKTGEPASSTNFIAIQQAYHALSSTSFSETFFNHVRDCPLHVLDYGLTLSTLNLLIQRREQLSVSHALLQHDDQKRLEEAYVELINLIRQAEQHTLVLNEQRDKAFFEYSKHPSAWKYWRRKVNECWIRYFAEEELDDLTYREAIAFGDLLSIAAKSKLYNPVKWVGFSATLVVLTLAYSLRELAHLLSQRTKLDNTVIFYAFVLLECFLSMILPVEAEIALFTFPLAIECLRLLANPYNEIFRPLMHRYENNPNTLLRPAIVFIALLGLASVGYALFALVLASYILRLKLIVNLTETNIALGTAGASLFGYQLFFENLLPALVGGYWQYNSLLLDTLCQTGFYLGTYRVLKVITLEDKALMAELPLPEKHSDDHFKKAWQQGGCNRGLASHRFFNTPVKPDSWDPAPQPDAILALF